MPWISLLLARRHENELMAIARDGTALREMISNLD
jgi:hypothetical protein